jgi:peroxiredoxin
MRRFDLIFYFGFLIIISLLGWKMQDLKKTKARLVAEVETLRHQQDSLIADSKSTVPRNSFCGKVVPDFSLFDIDSRNKFSFQKSENKAYFLFVFITPWDCPACFAETPFWAKLQSKFANRLTVLAIGTASSRETLRHFVQSNEISIPTLFDQGEVLFTELGLVDSGLTPIKILATSKGVMLHAAQSTYNDSTKQAQYIKLLDELVP